MRENGFRAIGGLAQGLTSGMAKGRGTSIVRLRIDWPAIVGPELARSTLPEAMLSGRGARSVKAGLQGTGKVLRLRVSGAAALEVQHKAGQLVERVNAYFGHRAIDDIRLVQGAIAQPPAPRPILSPDAATTARVAGQVAEVKDPDLRAALARLGARIAVNRRSVVVGVLGALFFADRPHAQSENEEKLMAVLPGDHVLGKPDAPNIIIDYFSLTCPHCANFSAAVLPVVRREWVDTGRARFVYRHFPSDSVATHAAQLVEGAGRKKFFDAVSALFHAQLDWLTSADPEAEMVKMLGEVGLSVEAAKACLTDDRLLDKVVGDVETGQALHVRATPTLFINEQNYGNPAAGGAEGISAILRQVGR
ncbi:MAG: DciA family protein [Reyranellales bacterium]